MANTTVTIKTTYRYWFWPMLYVGMTAIKLGADPDKIGRWLVKYGVKIEVE